MAFFDGKVNSTEGLRGKYKPFNFRTKKYDLPIVDDVAYKEEKGFTEEVEETMDDFQVSVSDIVLSSFANLPFRTQDKFIDQDGKVFKIATVDYEPDPNPYRTKLSDRRKFQNKILFME